MAKPKKSAPSEKKLKPSTKKNSAKTKPSAKKAAKKVAVKKPKLKKAVAKKPAPAAKSKSAPKPAKKAKPAAAAPVAKPARESKSVKKTLQTPVEKTKTPATAVARKAATKASEKAEVKTSARDLLRSRILGSKKATKPIAFSLEDAREIAKTTAKPTDGEASKTATPVVAKPDLNKLIKKIAPSHVKAASLSDILGFNPKKAQKPTLFDDPEKIPEKYRRYYKLLLELRRSLTEGLTLHTEETLRRSSKDDAGDLSSYGQHMADAGTDTFDRDFALSMVANEQEALSEIDAAIKRIKDGTYGICELTQKPIAKERLLAVPFTRYSTEAQKDLEKNRMRVRTAAGLFGEGGDDSGRGGGDEAGGDGE